jgi:hypothetical protein
VQELIGEMAWLELQAEEITKPKCMRVKNLGLVQESRLGICGMYKESNREM